MAVAGCRLPGNSGMELIERERLVADAIILERAIRVLERRFGESAERVPEMRACLFNAALNLRDRAVESDAADR